MCQYVVQRILQLLEVKVVDDPTGPDNGPFSSGRNQMGGFPGLMQVTGRAAGARRNRIGLITAR